MSLYLMRVCVWWFFCFFFFKQKTAYEMRISDWSSDVCSSDLERLLAQAIQDFEPRIIPSTLKVKLDLEPATMSHNAMTFDIEGELWAQPLPLRIRLRTDRKSVV